MKKLLLALMFCLMATSGWATDVIFQQGVSPDAGYSGCRNNYIDSRAATTNHAGETTISLTYYNATRQPIIIAFDCSTIIPAGATITACSLSMYGTYGDNADNRSIYAYRILKPWVAGTSTFNIFDTTLEWGTAGCESANDTGDYNSTDNGGYDRWSTPDATCTATQTNNWWIFSGAGMVASLQAQLDSGHWEGWKIFAQAGNIDLSLASSEYTTDSSKRPILTVSYTAAASTSPPFFSIINVE